MNQPVFALEDLTVDYLRPGGDVRALDGVSFAIAAGEIVGLCGESGSGKSTLALALPRLLPPPAVIVRGRARLGQDDLFAADEAALRNLRGRRIGLVPQSGMNALNPVISVERQIALSLRAHGRRANAVEIADLLRAVGLTQADGRAYPHQLSGGMRRRAACAIALGPRPALLVLDEATAGLDAIVARQLGETLRDLARRLGVSVLFISHDLPLTLSLADRVGVLHGGRLVEMGPTPAVAARPEHPYTASLLGAFLDPHMRARTAPAPALSPPPRSPAPPLLSLHGVNKTYTTGLLWRRRHVQALREVSLEVGVGEIVALCGASGSGKSTLARLAVRLERATSGELRWGGQALDRPPQQPSLRFRADVQIIFQDPFASLNPARRIFHHVARPLLRLGQLRGDGVRKAVHRLLESVELTPATRFVERFPHELSGGQRQRVAIARAIATDPRLLIADEPTSLLDASLRGELLGLLCRHVRSQRRGLLLITHDLGVARATADRIVVLEAGRVVEVGPVADVLDRPAHAHTAALLAALPRPSELGRTTS